MIRFKNLKGVYSRVKLARVVNDVLTKFSLEKRVVSITTDNASSNSTLLTEINSYLQDAVTENRFLDSNIQHIPCLAHVFQLALKALLGKIRLRPTNETFLKTWEADQELDELQQIQASSNRGIPYILAKVSRPYFILIFILTILSFENSLFLLILVVNADQRLNQYNRILLIIHNTP